MPRFEPFVGVRYDLSRVDLGDVIAPPYDVVDGEERARLAARSPYNSILVELPDEADGPGRYEAASAMFQQWKDDGVLVVEDQPAFYVYRMGFHDEAGRPRQTTGVLGALELQPPGTGDVLPHERTLPKAKTDRLELLRATRTNISPVWGLSLAAGLSALCEVPGPPVARATDDDGVHHRLWRVTAAGVVEAIAAIVASAPVVIADGHHRFETALAYREERRGATEAPAGGHDLMLAFVVELTEEQLAVGAIHRLLRGLPDGADLPKAFEPWFEPFEVAADEADTLPSRMVDAGALGLVTPAGAWLLRPRPEAFPATTDDLDSSRLEVALEALPGVEVAYQHGTANALGAVAKGDARAAVLLRPVTVEQIAAVARARDRMPQKTTFFTPKPRTGLVFRTLD